MNSSGSSRLSFLWLWLLAAVFFCFLALWANHSRDALGNPALVTGWWLFALLVLLGAFNARKKLSMLPLGNASTWLRIHVVSGMLVIALFWLHTRTLWPSGFYERALALSFYLVSVSGIIGLLLQKALPRRLSHTGVEIIYERIPGELANLRAQAEAIVLECTQAAGRDTLGRHYLETLDWFFRRPRFLRSHMLGGKHARAWQRDQCVAVRRYLDEREVTFLDRLAALAEYKVDIDFHYAAQTIMKVWLFVHMPLAVATLLLAGWHILLIHIYTL
jgi:hypothetical protein